MRVWIDFSNSPHPALFGPVAKRLGERGADVLITVRDHAQTIELARTRWPDAEILGSPGHSGKLSKLGSMARRVADCRSWARRHRPDVALSHNSYAQLVAARLLGMPAVTAMDYEYQPANHLAFRCAGRILLPEAVPNGVVRRQGARSRKVVRYPGLKEHLYLADFSPDPAILSSLGVERRPEEAVVVARSAPAGAAYHAHENPQFVESLRELASQEHVRCVVLVRHESQRNAIERLNLPNCVVPTSAVDGRSLLCAADMFIGAGGTMTREAALLGVPTFSIFGGRAPAVDVWLERQGRMVRTDRLNRLPPIRPRTSRPPDFEHLRRAAEPIVRAFVETTESVASDR